MSEGAKNQYKDTLNLPKTAFDMKANLLAKEPAMQAQWAGRGLYQEIRSARQGAKRFILHDGPPYANGNIHMGTALNKVLKDMVVRIKTMTGHDSPYIPGWDCHGLPIEQKVADDLGSAVRTMPAMEVRSRCRAYADKFARLQSDQFQRLGVMGEFSEPYMTMNPRYEAGVLEVFAMLVDRGLVHKQLKPVHWSIANRTALAEAELEYADREDSSIYVLFHLSGRAAEMTVPHNSGDSICLAVWTTTPWTLPANLAVAVHPDNVYQAVHVETTVRSYTLVVARERLESLLNTIRNKRPGWLKSHQVVGELKGAELVSAGLQYEHPLIKGKDCPVVEATYVMLDDGTGLVHTAPGHGIEDYGTGLKNKLEIYCPVQADGTFDDTAPAFLRGMNVWKANPAIIDHLSMAGALLAEEKITHSYPHDWRSKTPTIFRATEQWFVAVDRPTSDGQRPLREMAMDFTRREVSAGGIEFIPDWGRTRLAGMLESRPDWCISRQRVWGLPIPAFYLPDGKPFMTPTTVRAVAKVVADNGSDAWFTMTPSQLLAGYDPSADPALPKGATVVVEQLTKGADIFDVWFESGSSWFAVAMARGLVDRIPVDLYLEGSDQHRGWFQLSLLPALGAFHHPPFKTVLTHGFIVDDQGRKMSKSLGNTIDVINQLAKRGADVLRLWVASQNYQDDVRCSESLIAQTEDAYRKIRNTLRYCLGACGDFHPRINAVDPQPNSVDLWMRMELHRLIRDVREAFDRYEFHRATRLLYEFCTVQASSIYFSAVKDRLYCELPDSPRRRGTQTVIHEILLTLVKLLAPILPHTCEEAWAQIPPAADGWPTSIHLAALPDYDAAVLRMAEDLQPVNVDQAAFSSDELQTGPAWIWRRLLELRSIALVKMEALRNAGVKNSLDAEAVFHIAAGHDDAAALIQNHLAELEDLLGVGYARIETGAHLSDGQVADVEVVDTRERYKSCARSWKRRPDVGSDSEYPDLSARDAAVVRTLKKSGATL